MKKDSKKMVLKSKQYQKGTEKLYGIGKDKLDGRPSTDISNNNVKPSVDAYNTGLSKEERMTAISATQTRRHPNTVGGSLIANQNQTNLNRFNKLDEQAKKARIQLAKTTASPQSTIGKANTGGTGNMTPKQINNITPLVNNTDNLTGQERRRISREKQLQNGAKYMKVDDDDTKTTIKKKGNSRVITITKTEETPGKVVTVKPVEQPKPKVEITEQDTKPEIVIKTKPKPKPVSSNTTSTTKPVKKPKPMILKPQESKNEDVVKPKPIPEPEPKVIEPEKREEQSTAVKTEDIYKVKNEPVSSIMKNAAKLKISNQEAANKSKQEGKGMYTTVTNRKSQYIDFNKDDVPKSSVIEDPEMHKLKKTMNKKAKGAKKMMLYKKGSKNC